MIKDEYINKIVCEYWFGFKNWCGVDIGIVRKTFFLAKNKWMNVMIVNNRVSIV